MAPRPGVRAAAAALFVACTAVPPSRPTRTPDRPAGESKSSAPAIVTRVVDGDTVEASFHGRSLDVRLIGVDAPETVDPFEPVECYGPAASRYAQQRLGGERVRLEFDVERTDGYGRALAYVWLGRHLFNHALVRRGFATVSTYPPNVRYVQRFRAAQRAAKRHHVGLWGVCSRRAPRPRLRRRP